MKRHRRHKDDEPSFKDYVLAELRAAHIRARMLVKEIETIGVAVRGNVIDGDMAIGWMAAAFMLDFLEPPADPAFTGVSLLQPGTDPLFLPPRYWSPEVWKGCPQ